MAEATVRVNITLPEKTLAQIDRKAAAKGMSRSSSWCRRRSGGELNDKGSSTLAA
jgi:HicB_like antitoxin of bacterial toxin-antitoxin system